MAVLLLAWTLTACGGGGDNESSGERTTEKGGGGAPAAQSSARNEADGAGRRGGGRDGEPGARKSPQAPQGEGRDVVHTAQLRVRAGDVDASAAKAKHMVIAAGGYVERESSRSDPARSEIALKIPSARYTELLNGLSTQLGTKLSLTQEAEDVTGEVADVEARVRSAEATLASFRKLLERAGSVSEIIKIEEEIADRESDLEALQAREKSLKHRTRFATVTVTLSAEVAPPKEDDERGGFVGALGDGWDAFATFVVGAAIVLAWLLPFLIAAALIAVPVLAFRHRLRERFGRRSAPAASRGPGPRPEPEKASVGSGPAGPPARADPSGPSGPGSPKGPPPPA